MRPNFIFWPVAYQLTATELTKSCIEKVRNVANADKQEYLSLLFFLYASGIADEEKVGTIAKAELIKNGESSIVTLDRKTVLEEVNHDLDKLSTASPSEYELWKFKSLRLASLLLITPLDDESLETILDAITLLARLKSIPADAAFILLYDVYEKMLDNNYKRFFTRVDPDFWENYAAMAIKVMGRYLHDAAMEFVIYYELPPGASNRIHLDKCRNLCEVAVECCQLAHRTSSFIEAEVDRSIYKFCTEAISRQTAQPLITYCYRLLDESSEDFFITLPKEQISKYLTDAMKKLPQTMPQ